MAKRIGKLDSLDAILREMARVYRASRRGEVDVADANKWVWQLKTMGELRRAMSVDEIEERLRALEARYK